MDNSGQALQVIGAGLSLLNPVFSTVSMIGGLLSGAEQKQQSFLNTANQYLANAQNAQAGLYNSAASITAHENNISRLTNAIGTVNTNIGRIGQNLETLDANYNSIQRQLGAQGSQIKSYQDLLYSVSGVREGGTRDAIRSFTDNQLDQQGNQTRRSYETARRNLLNTQEDLETEAENIEDQIGFEEEGIREISGANLPEGYDSWNDVPYATVDEENGTVTIDLLDENNNSEQAVQMQEQLKGISSGFKEWVKGNMSWLVVDKDNQLEKVLSGEAQVANMGFDDGGWLTKDELVSKFLESDAGKGWSEDEVLDALGYMGYGNRDLSKYTETFSLDTGKEVETPTKTDEEKAQEVADMKQSLLDAILDFIG